MITRKVGPALAAGCTAVIKPANQTPLTALKLVELAHEAGIPNGVLNVVTGKSSEIGDAWLKDSRVTKLTFTGSTEVGKTLMRGAAENVKKISLELGGNAPFIVMPDANLSKAAAGLYNLNSEMLVKLAFVQIVFTYMKVWSRNLSRYLKMS